MDNSTRHELNAPLVQQAQAPSSVDDDVDRYDALGLTVACKMSSRSLINVIIDKTSTRATSSRATSPSSGDEADAAAGSSQADSLTSFALAVVLFFNAGGGPFGVELSLKAAGNLYALIGFAVMPFLYSLPEAVMTYELSSLYPCASGGVRWTEEAFGQGLGLFAGYMGWLSGSTVNACFPVLFLSYVNSQFFEHVPEAENNFFVRLGILSGITVVLALVNYRGLSVVGNASALIFLVSMAPFVLMVIIGISKVDPQKWLQMPTEEGETFDDDKIDQEEGWLPHTALAGIVFRPFVNNLYWNFNGFDEGGHYSTVVKKKTLRNGIIGSFLLVSSSYLLPMLVATGATDLTQDDWREGSFARAATEIGGRWLGNWIVVSAGVSLLAQFITGMSANSLQILGMADRGQLPSICSRRSPYDTPTYGLLFGVLIIIAMIPLPFATIVELSNFASCFSLMLQFLAFVQLRIRKGDCSWLRKIFYFFMVLPPLLFNAVVILLASYATYIYGACAIVFGVALIGAKKVQACCLVGENL